MESDRRYRIIFDLHMKKGRNIKCKKIIKLGMAALTALTMAGCSIESEDVKTITVGISPDYAPYESENKKGRHRWI